MPKNHMDVKRPPQIEAAINMDDMERNFWIELRPELQRLSEWLDISTDKIFKSRSETDKSSAAIDLLKIAEQSNLLAGKNKDIYDRARQLYTSYSPSIYFGKSRRLAIEAEAKNLLDSDNIRPLMVAAFKSSSLPLPAFEDLEIKYTSLIASAEAGGLTPEIESELDNLELEMSAAINHNPDIELNKLKRQAMNAVYHKILNDSPISQEDASTWASAQYITPEALARLEDNGYSEEEIRRDLAELCRLTRGRLDRLQIITTPAEKAQQRAYALVIESSIVIDDDFTRNVLFHEAAHLLERDPVTRAISQSYILSRATSTDPQPLSQLTGDDLYTDEQAIPDNFFDAYVGRVYRDGFTEVMSMGIQQFSSPERMALLYEQDPQLFEIIVGFMISEEPDTKDRWDDTISDCRASKGFYEEVLAAAELSARTIGGKIIMGEGEITAHDVVSDSKKTGWFCYIGTKRRAFFSRTDAMIWTYLEQLMPTEQTLIDNSKLLMKRRVPAWYVPGTSVIPLTLPSPE